MTSRTVAELVEALKTHHPEAEVVPLSRIAAGDVVLVQHEPVVQWAEVVAATEHGEEGAFFHFIELFFAQWQVLPLLRPPGVPVYRMIPVAADSWKERNSP